MTSQLAAVLHGPHDLRIEAVPDEPLRAGAVRVAVRSVGICGSDMHYYSDGRNGTNVIAAPTILGHEGAGVIVGAGEGVSGSRIGENVVIEPALPCLRCATCLAGRYNVCPFGTCFGSPPTNGLLRTWAVVDNQFAHSLPDTIDPDQASLLEPLAVAVWATMRAGDLTGRQVLVTGAGPIGLLVLQSALRAGAASVVVTDVSERRLEVARALGAAHTLVAGREEISDDSVDVLFECSGRAAALPAVSALRPSGVLLVVGVQKPGAVPFPLAMVQRWEIDVRGCFRYGPGAFKTAIGWAADGRIDLGSLITSRYPLTGAEAAITAAITDNSQLKVVIDLSTEDSHS
jgi:L-iditol 2-dehydrogenase